VAKSPSEQIREMTVGLGVLEERVDTLLAEVKERRAADDKRRDEIADLRRELAAVRQDNAVLRQQLQDHVAQYQEWDRRRWGLIVLLVGAVMSLTSGLVITLARK
jgi:chromosome segregation ATPase